MDMAEFSGYYLQLGEHGCIICFKVEILRWMKVLQSCIEMRERQRRRMGESGN